MGKISCDLGLPASTTKPIKEAMVSGCDSIIDDYIYGGYHCNELGCDKVVFHKECAIPLPTINHPSHTDHSLHLLCYLKSYRCSHCDGMFKFGYSCLICDYKLDLRCAKQPVLVLPDNPYGPEHPPIIWNGFAYKFQQSTYYFNQRTFNFSPEVSHTSHQEHPFKLLNCGAAPNYADEKCLLCARVFEEDYPGKLYHCYVCNFSICRGCSRNPPPLDVVSLTTHCHQLFLFPRLITFTCNACGTQGDRSPYFCHQCNFMIHRECIDLPRLININRHNHRISYTRRLGHDAEWKCGVCRKKVDGFYGAYACTNCSNYVVHSRCATDKLVWDMVELEGTPEEPEESPPFEEIDGENTIKHFSHDHNLLLHMDDMILPESTLCVACVFQICSEPFYSCEQCDFILHQKCANLPRKKRHLADNKPFTLQTDSLHETFNCFLCNQRSTGFRYKSYEDKVLDVRCGSVSEPLEHGSHRHPLYYHATNYSMGCSRCMTSRNFSCDECDFGLDLRCATLPRKVMRLRYDDHPLCLSYGESSVNGDYWCEACETKVDPEEWFYTCSDCGVILHVSCVEGYFTYIKPGTYAKKKFDLLKRPMQGKSSLSATAQVVPNTSASRPLCSVCKSRCKLPSIVQISGMGNVEYVCSYSCYSFFLPANIVFDLF